VDLPRLSKLYLHKNPLSLSVAKASRNITRKLYLGFDTVASSAGIGIIKHPLDCNLAQRSEELFIRTLSLSKCLK